MVLREVERVVGATLHALTGEEGVADEAGCVALLVKSVGRCMVVWEAP